MFRFTYEKPSAGEIKTPKKNYQVNYIKPLFMSVYIFYLFIYIYIHTHIHTLKLSR